MINEKVKFKSSKEYFDNLFNTIGLNLIVRQANNLKGQLGKHPIKQNLNKLKAVEKQCLNEEFHQHLCNMKKKEVIVKFTKQPT